MKQEMKSKKVAARSKHGEEAQLRHAPKGVELGVWTDRMLAALKSGVKGGKWFSLKDKVYAGKTLRLAWMQVESNRGSHGVDKVRLKEYETNLDRNLEKLQLALKEGFYKAQAVRRVWIPKPGSNEKRPLGIPTVEDRIVQTALMLVIEPIFENMFHEHSYGFRPGRGCKDALKEVEKTLEEGKQWVVDADLKGYFDTIDHKKLMELIRKDIADGLVLNLVEQYLNQGVLNELGYWEPSNGKGSPQGAVISPLLANLYLNELDHKLNNMGYKQIRYADDFLILCSDEQGAMDALEIVKIWTQQKKLILHPEKTKLLTLSDGIEFLGYHYKRHYRFVRQKSLNKFKDSIREKTKRCNGHSIETIIKSLNKTLKGWYGYFNRVHFTVYRDLDSWIRGRLRSILRKRRKRKGKAKGRDHQRWPNRYFADMGYYSLLEAHKQASSVS